MNDFKINVSDVSEGDLIQIRGGFFLITFISEEEKEFPVKINIIKIIGKAAWGTVIFFKNASEKDFTVNGHFKIDEH